jgi:hypothetical protein
MEQRWSRKWQSRAGYSRLPAGKSGKPSAHPKKIGFKLRFILRGEILFQGQIGEPGHGSRGKLAY